MSKEELKEGIEKINKDIEELYKCVWRTGQFLKILMKGHKTERRHKDIYNLMFKKLCKFSEEEIKKRKNAKK